MKRADKVTTIEELHRDFQAVKSAILLDYKGLDVARITELRNRLREENVRFRVIKNTLSIRAAKDTDVGKLEPFFTGPTAVTLSDEDPVAGIKTLDAFIRENPSLKYKVALIEGTLIDKAQISALANLPPRDVLLSKLLGTMQAPVASFVRVIAGNISGLLNVMNGIRQAKTE
ncbi:50S ribosomal protein L10 [bacterium]|nr:50S ribosomal protein L10 [candidate division CSSED10-310 bacterium]